MAERNEVKDLEESSGVAQSEDVGTDSVVDTTPTEQQGHAEGAVERRSRIFDIVLQSPTSTTPLSLVASPYSPSAPSPMTSSTDVIGTGGVACYGDERRMLADLGYRFYNRRLLSDVRLRVGDRVYRAHKMLLARASDVLEKMLCSTAWNEAVKQVHHVIIRCIVCNLTV